MCLDPSQVYPGNTDRLKYKHVLPVRPWGTRRGMMQPATQALDLECLEQLALRVQALRKGCGRQEVHLQTMAEDPIPTRNRNQEELQFIQKENEVCGVEASGQENSSLLC